MIWIDRCYRYLVYAVDLDDGGGTHDWQKSSLSATKACGYAAALGGVGIAIAKKDVTAPINYLVLIGITALFGRSMWKTFLLRNQFTTSMTDTRETKIVQISKETKQILEGRDVERGIDPSQPRPDPAHRETAP